MTSLQKSNSNFSDFLYANPSFILGMASSLDVGSTLTVYNESETPILADYRAIKADWAAIGKDITLTIKNNPIENAR